MARASFAMREAAPVFRIGWLLTPPLSSDDSLRLYVCGFHVFTDSMSPPLESLQQFAGETSFIALGSEAAFSSGSSRRARDLSTAFWAETFCQVSARFFQRWSGNFAPRKSSVTGATSNEHFALSAQG